MPDPTEPLNQRADARANRDALLDAAAALFAERGIDVSYEEIAERAGVGRATLYRHFPTRDLLLAGLLERLIGELEAAAAATSQQPDGLFDLFDFCVRVQRRHLPIVDLASQNATTEQLLMMRRRFVALLRDPLARAQTAGVVGPELTVDDVRMLLIMISSLTRKTITDADRARALALARAILTQNAPS
jgi:AcrR family transcriptional regulator